MNETAEVLDKEEIDALLRGVDSSEVQVESGTSVAGEVSAYDMATHVRVVRGRMPTLEMIYERFARSLRVGFYTMLRREPEISVAPIHLLKFSDYAQTLHTPSSLNLVKLPPLRGTALFMLDSKLVSALVDNFFGGTGRSVAMDGREFTSTEKRIVQIVLRQAYADLQGAWAPVKPLQVEYQSSEISAQFVNAFNPAEVVVVAAFPIKLDGAGGELHIAMPYTMIEPIRELLDSGVGGEAADGGDNWTQALREELEDVDIEVVSLLGHSTVTVGQLLNLKPGDVIPCDFDGQATLLAEGVPFLRGTYGASRGQQAVKIVGRLARRSQFRGADAPVSAP
jgi:flagellar motor switch protein FliM